MSHPKFEHQEKLLLFIVSAAVIVLQIVLMRSLAVRFYSHFSYIIIGIALLGFGASGTFLYLTSHVLQKNFRTVSIALPALFFLSISLSYAATLKIPVDIQYIFFSGKHLFYLIVLKSLLFIPFFFGAKNPILQNTLKQLAEMCSTSRIDMEYHPGIDGSKTNHYNQIASPTGKPYSYFHHSIRQILFGNRDDFFDDWIYRVRPKTEDAPYFYNFFKWRSLTRFIATYKTNLFQKLEVAYLVLALSLGEMLLSGFLLILLPLLVLGSGPISVRRKVYSSVYFFSIGLCFILIEMIHIQKFTQFLGDPIYSVSLVLTIILISAGMGSEFQSRIRLNQSRKICLGVLGIILISIANFSLLSRFMTDVIQLKMGFRFVIAAMLLMPLGFMMGWLFPVGITILQKNARDFVPWAWGINGYASVIAAPLAVMLSMSFGFTIVLTLALLLYT